MSDTDLLELGLGDGGYLIRSWFRPAMSIASISVIPQNKTVMPGQSHTPPWSSIRDLPYDILFELFRYLSGRETAYLLSTCRTLHAHLHEFAIWQRLSARYGLRDLTNFHGLSFYTVYTQLMHPYGPLIGIWASDHHFRGNIIEFRLLPGSETESGGIIGELWRFSDAQSGDTMPRPPEYVRILKIGFDTHFVHENESEVEGVRIVCTPGVEDDASGSEMHESTIEVMPPSENGLFLQEYRRTHPHPDFPCRVAHWYDHSRGLPRLKMSAPVDVDQRNLVSIYPAVRLPIVFTAPAGPAKPPAISISCGRYACNELHQPFVPFDDIIPFPPRYYPLKRAVQRGVDPEATEWRLESLAGLWLGMHGQQGTECLFISWHADERALRAWKITGDINVPRGVCSWTLHTHVGVSSRHPAVLAAWTRVNPFVQRVYAGTGTISERGFAKPTSVDLIVGITGADEIKIWWDQVNDTRTYIRYTGRDL